MVNIVNVVNISRLALKKVMSYEDLESYSGAYRVTGDTNAIHINEVP